MYDNRDNLNYVYVFPSVHGTTNAVNYAAGNCEVNSFLTHFDVWGKNGQFKWNEKSHSDPYKQKPEVWFEYNSKNLKVHMKNSNDYEEWFEYDEKGNMICCKNSYDEEKFYEYDDKGNLIHRVNFDGSDVWIEYEFYGDGKKKAVYFFKKI